MVANNFEIALAFTLRHEGGYANDSNDSGGQTNFGVTHTTYDTYRKSKKLPLQSVKLIDRAEVNEIYRNFYWLPAGCNLLSPNLARCHFDWAVNHGVQGAIVTLQKVVGSTPDGKIGPRTTQAILQAIAKHGDQDLAMTYCLLRENWYRNHAVQNPDQQKFLEGWLNRVRALRTSIA
jgi:lysozyme family protein